jgi:hypothetical protein
MLSRILLLGPAELIVYRLQRGHITEAFAFGDDPSGHAGFARYLADAPALPTGLLIDRPDEQFRVETVPHVWSGRAALLARHGERLFAETPYRSARVLGRERHGRRDDRVLFSALVRPETLAPWLDALGAQPLAAITSAAFLDARLLGKAERAGAVLLASLHEGGLRQTLLVDGELRLSRLVALPEGPDDAAVAAEIAKTRQYVQRADGAGGNPLRVHLLAPGRPHHVEDAAALPLETLARAHRASGHACRDARALRVELLARTSENRYATAEQLAAHRRRRRLDALHLCAWGTVLGLAVAAAQNVAAGRQAELAMAEARQQLATVRAVPAETDAIARAATMRALVSAADAELAARLRPRVLLAPLGAVLAQFPEVRLDRLELTDQAAPEGTPNVAITAHIAPYSGVPQEAEAVLDRLVGALEALPEARVSVRERPFATPGALSGATGEQPAQVLPRFSLHLSMGGPR